MWMRPLVASVVVALGSAVPAQAQPGRPVSLPDGEGRRLVESACTSCHALNLITRSPGYDTAEEWRDIVTGN